MLKEYLISIIGIVSLMIIWMGVQSMWRKMFSAHLSDEDALAERTRCTNCGCTTVCKNKRDL
ncbi:MAG: hypothetical protein ABJF04_22275 [Reichenbachiella sp.]|uniref:hypothetical protein n=1 Tax=Reichenbachiella sp. TaxID=2184521 RepID=UPI0032663B67